jgi:multidrug efflux pump subunit AcrA (membrane-fusion protein)
MLMKKIMPILLSIVLVIGLAILFVSCGPQTKQAANQPADVITPVQTVTVDHTPLCEYIELTAVSSYQQRSYVKANVNGYIQSANVVIGKQVNTGTLLFSLITKEARAIGNAVNQLDPALKFSGVSAIRANLPGFITGVSHQKGDYVQDGETLAVISNQNSFVFLLDLPYELRGLINNRQPVELTMPDGEKLSGKISGSLAAVDSVAQTQKMIINVNAAHTIPEGLVAKVRVNKASSPNAQVVPKSAVLSNETEDEFWVMKMINDSTAVKVPVKKGIENDQVIEILAPLFNLKDRIINVGNYGIADTAKVKVVKQL